MSQWFDIDVLLEFEIIVERTLYSAPFCDGVVFKVLGGFFASSGAYNTERSFNYFWVFYIQRIIDGF